MYDVSKTMSNLISSHSLHHKNISLNKKSQQLLLCIACASIYLSVNKDITRPMSGTCKKIERSLWNMRSMSHKVGIFAQLIICCRKYIVYGDGEYSINESTCATNLGNGLRLVLFKFIG